MILPLLIALSSAPLADRPAPDGATVFSQHCGRCHAPRPPAELEPERWPAVLYHMRTRAYLTRAETRALEAFFVPPASPMAPGAAGDSPLLGNPVFAQNCLRCHPASRVEVAVAAGRTADQWVDTLKRMRTYGAGLSAEEASALSQWLASQ